jgi:hypothetical protein
MMCGGWNANFANSLVATVPNKAISKIASEKIVLTVAPFHQTFACALPGFYSSVSNLTNDISKYR